MTFAAEMMKVIDASPNVEVSIDELRQALGWIDEELYLPVAMQLYAEGRIGKPLDDSGSGNKVLLMVHKRQ